MYRIDNASAVASLPTATSPGPQPNSYFFGGTPPAGVDATIVEAEWLNMTQEELANVVLAAGLTLDKGDRTQLLQAIQRLGRNRLSANLNLYVSTTGNDANDGQSSATAWRTLQHAWNNVVGYIDLNGHNVIVNVADGTYTQGLLAAGAPLGYGTGNTVNFVGNVGAPGNCVVSVTNGHCFEASNGAFIGISGFQMTGTGTDTLGNAACCIVATGSSNVTVEGAVTFAACPGQHAFGDGGSVTFLSSYAIAGGAQSHILAGYGSIVSYSGASLTVTLSGTPAFANGFVAASSGFIQAIAANTHFTGTASGPRYSASLNGIINTGGGGATFFPGSAPGTVGSGGQYI